MEFKKSKPKKKTKKLSKKTKSTNSMDKLIQDVQSTPSMKKALNALKKDQSFLKSIQSLRTMMKKIIKSPPGSLNTKNLSTGLLLGSLVKKAKKAKKTKKTKKAKKAKGKSSVENPLDSLLQSIRSNRTFKKSVTSLKKDQFIMKNSKKLQAKVTGMYGDRIRAGSFNALGALGIAGVGGAATGLLVKKMCNSRSKDVEDEKACASWGRRMGTGAGGLLYALMRPGDVGILNE